MMQRKWLEMNARYDFMSNSIAFAVFERGEAGQTFRQSEGNLVLVPREEPANFSTIEDPTFVRISREAARLLMNDLWHAGIRPDAAKASAGQLEALQRHLDDMRRITFSKLDVPEPTGDHR